MEGFDGYVLCFEEVDHGVCVVVVDGIVGVVCEFVGGLCFVVDLVVVWGCEVCEVCELVCVDWMECCFFWYVEEVCCFFLLCVLVVVRG